MSTQEESRKWFKRYYGQLVGMTVVKAGIGEVDEFGDEGFPFFILKAKDGTKVKIEVSQDQEGNGPGFLFIGDHKEGGTP